MSRRLLLGPVVVALLSTAAAPTFAQSPVGVILGNDSAFGRAVVEAFEAELKRAGVDSEILVQSPHADTLAWANTTRKLGAFDVGAIFVVGAPIGLEGLIGKLEVPIIYALPSHQAPGKPSGSVAGVRWNLPLASVVKYLEAIRDFSKLGIVAARGGAQTKQVTAELDRLATSFGYATVALDGTSGAPPLAGVDAIFVTESCASSRCLATLLDAARRAAVPTASVAPGAGDAGVLITLEADPAELGSAAARLVAQALNGTAPASLPVVTARKIAMVINLKEAGAMGLNVPFDVLSAAGRVIK